MTYRRLHFPNQKIDPNYNEEKVKNTLSGENCCCFGFLAAMIFIYTEIGKLAHLSYKFELTILYAQLIISCLAVVIFILRNIVEQYKC